VCDEFSSGDDDHDSHDYNKYNNNNNNYYYYYNYWRPRHPRLQRAENASALPTRPTQTIDRINMSNSLRSLSTDPLAGVTSSLPLPLTTPRTCDRLLANRKAFIRKRNDDVVFVIAVRTI